MNTINESSEKSSQEQHKRNSVKFVQRGNIRIPVSILNRLKPKQSFFEREEARCIREAKRRKQLVETVAHEWNAERFAEQQNVLREMQKRVHELQDEMDRIKEFADDIASGLETVVGVYSEKPLDNE